MEIINFSVEEVDEEDIIYVVETSKGVKELHTTKDNVKYFTCGGRRYIKTSLFSILGSSPDADEANRWVHYSDLELTKKDHWGYLLAHEADLVDPKEE